MSTAWRAGLSHIRQVPNRLVHMDKTAHAYIASRFPKTLATVDRVSGAVYEIICNPIFSIIVALLLVVLVATGVVNLIVSVAIVADWVLSVFWIARSGVVRKISIPSRLIVLIGSGLLLAFLGERLGSWALDKYDQQHSRQAEPPLVLSKVNELFLRPSSNDRGCFNVGIHAFTVDVHYNATSGPDIEDITVKLNSVYHNGEPDADALWQVVLQQRHKGSKDEQERTKEGFKLRAGGTEEISVISSHPWYPQASYIYNTDPNADDKLPPGRCALHLGIFVSGRQVGPDRVFETYYDPETRCLEFWPQESDQPKTPNSPVKLPKLSIEILPENQQIVTGKTFGGICRWTNVGPGKMFNAICYSQVYILDVVNDRAIIRKIEDKAGNNLAQETRMLGKEYCEGKVRGKEIGVGESLTAKAFTRSLTPSDFEGIAGTTKRIYVVSWIAWEDSEGKKDSAHDCQWLQYPYRSAEDWRHCRASD
ncbi:MAG TPA: hypothetical protein VJ464_10135 [Blastocatellia bacterium]|nr:hypothetical protein [Blastocatellia bacterium]